MKKLLNEINSSLSLLKKQPEPVLDFEIDYEKMKQRCLMPMEMFCDVHHVVRFDVNAKYYYYLDNGASVLGVAHLDTVQPPAHFERLVLPHRDLVFSPTLDDRLGVYVILDLLPKLIGHKYDILLTIDEEKGDSSAKLFKSEKQYNWMFEFDRRGDDVALYQYYQNQAVNLFPKYGLQPTHGSYTDIANLEHLGCFGMNVGVGYDDAHSLDAWADMDILRKMVSRFVRFFNDHHETHFPFITPPEKKTEEPYLLDDLWNEPDTFDPDVPVRPMMYKEFFCRECGQRNEPPDSNADPSALDEYEWCYLEAMCPDCLYQLYES
jgi:hypothetical protein